MKPYPVPVDPIRPVGLPLLIKATKIGNNKETVIKRYNNYRKENKKKGPRVESANALKI
jgi:hypothetical protein